MSKSDASGAGDQSGGAGSDTKKDAVAYETYSKVMDELKDLQRKLKEIDETKKTEEEKKLKEANDWKTLYEQTKSALEEKESKLENFQKDLNDSIKISAFNKHLGGKLKNDKYIDFIDLEKIAINPETRKVDSESVKLAVASFLKEHSHLVEFKGGKMPEVAAAGLKNGKVGGTADKPVEKMTSSDIEAEILRRVQSGEVDWK